MAGSRLHSWQHSTAPEAKGRRRVRSCRCPVRFGRTGRRQHTWRVLPVPARVRTRRKSSGSKSSGCWLAALRRAPSTNCRPEPRRGSHTTLRRSGRRKICPQPHLLARRSSCITTPPSVIDGSSAKSRSPWPSARPVRAGSIGPCRALFRSPEALDQRLRGQQNARDDEDDLPEPDDVPCAERVAAWHQREEIDSRDCHPGPGSGDRRPNEMQDDAIMAAAPMKSGMTSFCISPPIW